MYLTLLWAISVATGCYHHYPARQSVESFKTADQKAEIQFLTEAPAGAYDKARRALELLEQVRNQPDFNNSLQSLDYDFSNEKQALRSVAEVVRCAQEPILVPWKVRYAPWLRFWPFKKEVGRTVWIGDDSFYVQTYDSDIANGTEAALAGHFLHEHMHTCGFEDGGGFNERRVTYQMNYLVEHALGAREKDCPKRTQAP